MESQNSENEGRPVEESHLEIAGTFQDAGTRPIEESPEFLLSDTENIDDKNKQSVLQKNANQSDINSVPPLD